MSTLFSEELSKQIVKEVLHTLGLTVSNIVLEGIQKSLEVYLWKAYEVGKENGQAEGYKDTHKEDKIVFFNIANKDKFEQVATKLSELYQNNKNFSMDDKDKEMSQYLAGRSDAFLNVINIINEMVKK